jgi:DNA-binding response OmpR family regulator
MSTIRILVVYTDPADLAVVASVAAAQEFELRVLERPTDLVGEAASYQPDAIVIDVDHKETDGLGLCTQLKADSRTAGIPVVMISVTVSPERRRTVFMAGADDFLEKPIHRHNLAHRLHSFARLRRAWIAAWAELQE